MLQLSKQTTLLRAVTRTSAKQENVIWPGDWLKSRRWKTINHNESESSSLEGQGKVIRLSISNPFSSLKHIHHSNKHTTSLSHHTGQHCLQRAWNYGVYSLPCALLSFNWETKKCGPWSLNFPHQNAVFWEFHITVEPIKYFKHNMFDLLLLQHYWWMVLVALRLSWEF